MRNELVLLTCFSVIVHSYGPTVKQYKDCNLYGKENQPHQNLTQPFQARSSFEYDLKVHSTTRHNCKHQSVKAV